MQLMGTSIFASELDFVDYYWVTDMIRSLYSTNHAPYYVYALDYIQQSAGIRALHYLCHALNEDGFEAYVTCNVTHLPLRTPVLTEEVVNRHRAAGRVPITVYPEIVSGNPLAMGGIVARWLLNRPGLIGGDTTYAAEDLIFAYDPIYLPEGMSGEILHIPTTDLSIFNNDNNPNDATRDLVCFYAHKYLWHGGKLTEHVKNAISLGKENKLAHAEIAALLRRSKLLYVYEPTVMMEEALLCGCPVAIIETDYWRQNMPNFSYSKDTGLVMADSTESLEVAKANLHLHTLYHKGAILNAWHQLDRFVEITQEVARLKNEESVISESAKPSVELPLKESLTPVQEKFYQERVASWSTSPKIHIGMIVPPGKERQSESTIASLERQDYPDVELTVVSDSAFEFRFQGMKIVPAGEDSWKTLNSALKNSEAEWFGIIHPGNMVSPHAFLFLAEAIHSHPEWRFVYSDENTIKPTGAMGDPHFKPDFNLDLLRSRPYIGGLALVKRDLFMESDGFDDAGALDLAFRAYETGGEKTIGHVAEALYHHAFDQPTYPEEKVKAALEAHLSRSGMISQVEPGLIRHTFKVRYQHDAKPLVTIVIPAKEPFSQFQVCLESVVEKTSYPNYQILLSDMGCTSEQFKAYLGSLATLDSPKLKVLPPSANLEALLEQALDHSMGDYLLLMDSRIITLQPIWLDMLMEHGQRNEVGVVGPRILDPQENGKIYSAGIVPCSSPAYRGESMNHPGYFGRLQVDQNYSAVSKECLLVKRNLLEDWLAEKEKCLDAFLEIDLCLSLRKKGFLTVWTPFSSMVINSIQAEPQNTEDERHLLWKKWLPQIANDPAYNRHLSVELCFGEEKHAELFLNPLPWRPIPRMLAVIGDSKGGSGECRVRAPLRALNDAGRIEGLECFVHHSPVGMERIRPDAVLLQYQIEERHIQATELNRKYTDAFYVFEIDDLVTNLSSRNANKVLFPPDTIKRLRKIASLVDRMVVSTEPLAAAYKGFCDDIRVAPNCIEFARWGHLKPERGRGRLPRVGWAGSTSHDGDLAFAVDLVKALADEVEWVFFGMCPEELKPLVEYHEPVPIGEYPARLASLNLDLAIAPLEIHAFNEAKSHLKLLEYGILGYPVICTDITPYQGAYPVTRLKNRFQEWVRAIREHAADLDECSRRGDALRDYVRQTWVLEDNLDLWSRVWLP